MIENLTARNSTVVHAADRHFTSTPVCNSGAGGGIKRPTKFYATDAPVNCARCLAREVKRAARIERVWGNTATDAEIKAAEAEAHIINYWLDMLAAYSWVPRSAVLRITTNSTPDQVPSIANNLRASGSMSDVDARRKAAEVEAYALCRHCGAVGHHDGMPANRAHPPMPGKGRYDSPVGGAALAFRDAEAILSDLKAERDAK